jgi:hypothetical protein
MVTKVSAGVCVNYDDGDVLQMWAWRSIEEEMHRIVVQLAPSFLGFVLHLQLVPSGVSVTL